MEIKYGEKMLELRNTLLMRSKRKFYSSSLKCNIYHDSVPGAYEYVALSGRYEDLSHYEVYFVIQGLFEDGILQPTATTEKKRRR